MNIVTPMPDGSVSVLTQAEANKFIGYLQNQLAHTREEDQPATVRMIEHLRAITNPEHAYEAFVPA